MYEHNMKKMIEFIEQNLTNTINLSIISREVGYSKFHLERIFKHKTGESIIEYVKKRKLTEAAKELIYTKDRIIDIAFKYNFKSQQSFTLAFKKYYKTTPGKYRKDQKNYNLYEKLTLNFDENPYNNILEVEEKEIASFSIAGLEYYGTNSNNEIPLLWCNLNNKLKSMDDKMRKLTRIGLCDYVEAFDSEKSEFTYLAGININEIKNIPSEFIVRRIPRRKYIVFTHKGNHEMLSSTYKYIYGTFFYNSQYELLEAPDFEMYIQIEPGKEIIKIFIPIK